MKDFKFFKPGDGDKEPDIPADTFDTFISIEDANRKLNEAGVVVYQEKNNLTTGKDPANRWATMTWSKRITEALLICPRPIEQEPCECVKSKDIIRMFIESGIAKAEYFVKECPKCGEALR